MKRLLLMTTLLPGLWTLSSCLPRQYLLINKPRNWTEAQRYCREKYTDLVTVDNMEDMNKLANMFTLKQTPSPAWSGLYSTGSWSWSLPDSQNNQLGQAEFRNWKSGKPSRTGAEPLCASMDSSTGKWEEQLCTTTLKFVCQGETFECIQEGRTWTEAQSYCRQTHRDLASVTNLADNQHIQSTLPPNTAVWIGLKKDPWRWSDGSKSPFTCWSKGQPNANGFLDNCQGSVIQQNKQCNDWDCYYELPFFCYSVPVHRQVVRMSVTRENSGVDLEDPAVMEDILRQVQVKLREKGVTEDFQLRWRKQPDGKVFHEEEGEI